MKSDRSEELTQYSVLVERTVTFWDRVEVEARSPEEAGELAEEEAGSYDWSNSAEVEVAVRVEKDGEVLVELAWEH